MSDRVSALHSCLAAAGLLLVTIVVFSPRWWLWNRSTTGSYEWSRGSEFLKQCEAPFRRDIEPALHWRPLPALVAHGLGFRDRRAFIISWVGILACLAYAIAALRRRLPTLWDAVLAAVPFATSMAVLFPLRYLGINDAWAWLGLLVVAFGRSTFALAAAALLCPWVDERFVVGFPIALLVRALERGEEPGWRAVFPLAWLAPYIIVRLLAREPAGEAFLFSQVQASVQWLPLVPLGWWMAFRAGWLGIAAAFPLMSASWRPWAASLLAASLGISSLLAADISRSAAIAAPLMLWGIVAAARTWPQYTRRMLLALALASLLIPAGNVVYKSMDHIDSLPVELFRLWRAAEPIQRSSPEAT